MLNERRWIWQPLVNGDECCLPRPSEMHASNGGVGEACPDADENDETDEVIRETQYRRCHGVLLCFPSCAVRRVASGLLLETVRPLGTLLQRPPVAVSLWHGAIGCRKLPTQSNGCVGAQAVACFSTTTTGCKRFHPQGSNAGSNSVFPALWCLSAFAGASSAPLQLFFSAILHHFHTARKCTACVVAGEKTSGLGSRPSSPHMPLRDKGHMHAHTHIRTHTINPGSTNRRAKQTVSFSSSATSARLSCLDHRPALWPLQPHHDC